MSDGCSICRNLLHEALNLACRSDQFEEQNRRRAALEASSDGKKWEESGRFDDYVARHNANHPDRPIATKCVTMHLWVQDQYDNDLADWQRRARQHLSVEPCAALIAQEGET